MYLVPSCRQLHTAWQCDHVHTCPHVTWVWSGDMSTTLTWSHPGHLTPAAGVATGWSGWWQWQTLSCPAALFVSRCCLSQETDVSDEIQESLLTITVAERQNKVLIGSYKIQGVIKILLHNNYHLPPHFQDTVKSQWHNQLKEMFWCFMIFLSTTVLTWIWSSYNHISE